MKIKWLRKAIRDLDQEADHIANDDPATARLVIQRIHHAVNQLADNPALGHPGRVPDTRELVVPDTRYIIPYRVRPRMNQIEILRVFHTSRKPPQRW